MKLRSLTLISILCAVLMLVWRSQRDEPKVAPPIDRPALASRTPPEYRRSGEFTYLTLPEWYLVWSPQEYADFVVNKPPSAFPYLGHLEQFWQGYQVIYEATREKYPFNTDYHMMIAVIGTSTTAEYVAKGTYENTVGRLTEVSQRSGPTDEDRLAAQVARDYVDFIVVEPWYKFDFATPLRKVWETDFWGPDPVRKWERKYILTSEYAAKAVYGWVIKKASESVYDEEKPVSAVLVDRLPKGVQQELPDMKVVTTHADGAVLALLPRYQAFTPHAQRLAKAGVNFLEITGNRDAILVSAVVPAEFDAAGLNVLLKQPILTQPGLQRLVFTVPVTELAAMLRQRDQPAFRLEHIFDY